MAVKIPICPLMSAGNDVPVVCAQEKCAWYFENQKKCALYFIGYDSALSMRDRIANISKGKSHV